MSKFWIDGKSMIGTIANANTLTANQLMLLVCSQLQAHFCPLFLLIQLFICSFLQQQKRSEIWKNEKKNTSLREASRKD